MKKEELEQKLFASREAYSHVLKAYYQMGDLGNKMLRDMKRQFWIGLGFEGMWLIVGIFWGIILARWLL